jgi:hypothetical protein
MTEEPPRDPAPRDEPPPALGSWPRLYAVVLANLVVMIVLLVWFTKAFE